MNTGYGYLICKDWASLLLFYLCVGRL